ncbi:MAG: NYN domain-containing protein, partial [Actinobacteria bacterium]|nr:NYN domain-containing protein [Actinomycetota bacterium]
MDRCALFVDAGYVLADGAMAVHGTRHRGPVSWDYAGLLQFLNGLARDRTGLPVLRCYWYEATVEGRRTAEHDALADLPGLKLRLGRIRPGRRAGVESEIRRDLATLARNGAITDALVVSADEDLAQVVADVQDLGVRVTIVHLAVDGNWTISRPLRQECDDIIEVGDTHLRPYAGLIAGAESAHSEPQPAGADAGRPPANGYGTAGSTSHQQALPAVSSAAPSASYTAPVVAEHQPAAQPLMNGAVAALAPAGTADVTGAGAVLRRTGSTQETQVQPQGGHSQGESQPSQQGEQPQGRTDNRSQPAEPAQGQPAPAHGQPAFAQGQPAP